MDLDAEHRARIVVSLLDQTERDDLARAIDDWRAEREAPDSLDALWSALLEAAGDKLGELDLPE